MILHLIKSFTSWLYLTSLCFPISSIAFCNVVLSPTIKQSSTYMAKNSIVLSMQFGCPPLPRSNHWQFTTSTSPLMSLHSRHVHSDIKVHSRLLIVNKTSTITNINIVCELLILEVVIIPHFVNHNF
jgi:hypothetical protein